MNKSSQRLTFAAIAATVAGAAFYLLHQPIQKPQTVVVPERIKKQVAAQATSGAARKAPSYPETIRGDVITLKKLRLDMAFDFYSMFSANVRKGYEWPTKMTFGAIYDHLADEVKRVKKGLVVIYCIWDNKDDKLVGATQIRERNDADPGQFSIWINENYRGGGRAQEAILLISKTYFTHNPQAKDYISYIRPWNTASIRAHEKFGFKKKGMGLFQGKETVIFFITPEIIKAKEAALKKK